MGWSVILSILTVFATYTFRRGTRVAQSRLDLTWQTGSCLFVTRLALATGLIDEYDVYGLWPVGICMVLQRIL